MFLLVRYTQEYPGGPTVYDGLVSSRWDERDARALLRMEIERLRCRHNRGKGCRRQPVVEELRAPDGIVVRQRVTFHRYDGTVAGIYCFDLHELPMIGERIHPAPAAEAESG